jgi:hypothetical protein
MNPGVPNSLKRAVGQSEQIMGQSHEYTFHLSFGCVILNVQCFCCILLIINSCTSKLQVLKSNRVTKQKAELHLGLSCVPSMAIKFIST